MKIDDKLVSYEIGKHLTTTASDSKEKVERGKFPEGQTVVNDSPSDQDTIVELSSSLKEARLISEISSAEPDIREEKVAALKSQVDSGTYKVDPNAVADKLVDAHLEDIS